jgi:hypothetical protein
MDRLAARHTIDHRLQFSGRERLPFNMARKRCARVAQPELAPRLLPRRLDASACARYAWIEIHGSVTPRPVVASVLDQRPPLARHHLRRQVRLHRGHRTISAFPIRLISPRKWRSPDAGGRRLHFVASTGTHITTDTSAVRTMSTSSCPPTVSMITIDLPAASRTSATSVVARASHQLPARRHANEHVRIRSVRLHAADRREWRRQ